MADTLAGYPFWKLNFNDKAELPGGAAAAAADIASKNLTDLFIFSHGWNNDEATAMKLYEGFFGEVADLLKDTKIPKKATLSVGIAGVIWPSILFPGDTVPATGSAAASFSSGGEAKTLESELPLVFVRPEQQDDLQALLKLLDEQTPDNNALLEFRDRLNSLVKADAAQNTTGTGMDDLEFLATTVQSDSEWLRILDAFSVQPADDGSGDAGGAADFGSFFGRLWNGAKNALRTATYWQMKNRAGVVGKNGLGPLVGAIRAAAPSLRVHLLGHSFGARLVSYSLAGLPDAALKPDSPVKSLFLLQGAFSHFAFATKLPFDSSRHGDLIGMEARGWSAADDAFAEGSGGGQRISGGVDSVGAGRLGGGGSDVPMGGHGPRRRAGGKCSERSAGRRADELSVRTRQVDQSLTAIRSSSPADLPQARTAISFIRRRFPGCAGSGGDCHGPGERSLRAAIRTTCSSVSPLAMMSGGRACENSRRGATAPDARSEEGDHTPGERLAADAPCSNHLRSERNGGESLPPRSQLHRRGR